MGRSTTATVLDIFRYSLVIAGTVKVLCLSRIRFNGPLTLVLTVPVCTAMICFTDILALALYLVTPEHRATSTVLKAIENDDFDAALRVLEAHEKRHIAKRRRNVHSTTLSAETRQDELAEDSDGGLLPDGDPARSYVANSAENARTVRA